ncbi:phage tail protein [Paenibacillus sedimenti]|uniref:Phage tail protein n=1 Tax=Paenibacillus sedimenti TaxID=2770274 RepID=A0A926KQA8_9BACL|nr:tail fiber protein [Paenibacillus sedimenti]MBD0381960.1 phage tail protein [Paenibacillus sedimenti]
MSNPYVGEIRMFAGNFAPQGWAFCHGQLLAIAENDALFSLIGTTYGGNGQTTFALPDLRGRVPVHMGRSPHSGNTYTLGQEGGVETVTLILQQMPAHSHPVRAHSENGMGGNPKDGVWASSSLQPYSTDTPDGAMNAQAITSTGGNQPHDNMMPYVCVSYIISLYGILPSPN